MATGNVHRAFSNRRAFIVPNEGIHPNDPLRREILVTQAEDGPAMVRVGIECTDTYLREAWEGRKRFASLTLEQLMAARDLRVQHCEVKHG